MHSQRSYTLYWCVCSGKLIVQLGAVHAEAALRALAILISPDDPTRDGIVGIDLNMGCPKRCAEAEGSGSSLFADEARAQAMVRAVRTALPACIALSCKIRLISNGRTETLRRVRGLVSAGAQAVAVHCRRPEERYVQQPGHHSTAKGSQSPSNMLHITPPVPASRRPRDPCRWSELAELNSELQRSAQTVPLIANGDALDAEGVRALCECTGCQLVMVGRGALLASGCFEKEQRGVLPEADAVQCDADIATLELASRCVHSEGVVHAVVTCEVGQMCSLQ